MSTGSTMEREFTGRMFLAILVAFFGVIIAVNFTMAWFANSTWSGLVVKNSYVASQEFNGKAADAAAQLARGWKGDFSIADGAVRFRLLSASGAPVSARSISVTFRRPVSDREDITVTLAPAGDGWLAAHVVADGAWVVEVDADIGESQPWRHTFRTIVEKGHAG